MCAALLAGAGVSLFFIGRWSAPLQQSESRPSHPERVEVTVPVTRQPIQLRVALTGQVTAAWQAVVPMVAASDAARSVVTLRPLSTGAPITFGTRIVEISGRPLFAFKGQPAYRDLHGGDSGRDVSSLQGGLTALGYRPDTDGRFGAKTQAALGMFYASHGYIARRDAHGIIAPVNEFAYVPNLPARLADAPGQLGSDPTAKSIRVDSLDAPVAIVDVSSVVSARLPLGTPVVLQCGPVSVTGSLDDAVTTSDSVSGPGSPANGGAAAASSALSRAVQSRSALPGSAVGAQCSGSAISTLTPPVLAVPVSAVYSTAGGLSVLHVRSPTELATVTIDVGANAGGFVELRDAPPAVVEGTLVVVGNSSS